jgi:hypothetical protein
LLQDKLLTMDPTEITYDMVNKKLQEIILSRGKKGIDRQDQVEMLSYLATVAKGPYQKVGGHASDPINALSQCAQLWLGSCICPAACVGCGCIILRSSCWHVITILQWGCAMSVSASGRELACEGV